RRHTRSYGDWSSDVCSSDLGLKMAPDVGRIAQPPGLPDLVARAVRDDVGIPVGGPAPLREGAVLQPAQLRVHAVLLDVVPAMVEIGRASCRERVWAWGVEVG